MALTFYSMTMDCHSVAAAGVSKLLRHAPTPLLCALSSNFNEIFLGRSRVNLYRRYRSDFVLSEMNETTV